MGTGPYGEPSTCRGDDFEVAQKVSVMALASKRLLNQQTGIIIAADVQRLEDLRSLASISSEVTQVAAIKVGFTLGLRFGLPNVVKCIREVSDLDVIYDHQKAGTDIPQMGTAFAGVCRDSGVAGVILFPQAGPKTLEAFVKAAFDAQLTPSVGLVMTHDMYLRSEGGYISDDAPEKMAAVAVALGVTDFVLPGTKPEVVKSFASGALANVKDGAIMMPGIGSQGGALASSFRAADPHRRFAIIGSAIYGAKEPRTALQVFVEEMK
jgi:orotidine-5'-phosphate decarboxylase